MISEEIKDLLRSLPAVAVVENGRPAYVVTTLDGWRHATQGEAVRVTNGRPGNLNPSPSPLAARSIEQSQEAAVLERLNKEILSLREQIQMQEDRVGEAELL